MRRLATVILAALALGACGSEAASPSAPPSGSEPAPSTTEPAPGCGVVTAELMSTALGEPATFLGQDSSGCGFTAGRWSLGVSALPVEQATGPTPTDDVLNNDRSGLWQVHGAVVVDDVLYAYWLRNGATGVDTYPPVDGPEQKPITGAAAAALEDAITQTGE